VPPPPSSPAPKRRLTVLNNTEGPGDDSAERRPWQWVGFGALAIVTVWIPLLGGAGALASRLAASGAPGAGSKIVAAFLTAFGVGAALGGFLVGRWGAPGVGTRHAALAGLVASAVAAGVTWVAFGPSPGALLVALVAAPLAAVGGRWGVLARRR
jgi:hypothetical protein